MITIAQHCIKRLSIGRALHIGPGFVIRERPAQDRPTIKYLCINGNKTTCSKIASIFNTSNKYISDCYTRNGSDWAKTYKELGARL
jgi:hypothetical protein